MGGKPTVFVVDDEPQVRELARALLEMDGFEVVAEARNGGEAMQRLLDLDSPLAPTVVLLDNEMPVMRGMEAARRILTQRPDQLIVLFTAYLDEAMEREARRLGIAACVSKIAAADLPTIIR